MTNALGAAPAVPTDGMLSWAAGLELGALPGSAVEALRDDVVDALGCGLFGSTLPATQLLRETLQDQAGGPLGAASVWGTSIQTSVLAAVTVNAAAVNGFELDGGNHLTRNVHGGMAVYPAVLAVAQHRGGVTGADLIAAAAAGWEVSVRMSHALGPTVMDRGWYGTPIYATLGSCVAAGRALRLTSQQLQGAFELALLHASGLTVSSEEGMGKPLSSGEAVRSGVLCALLGQRGARGPRHSYAHPKGFAAAFSAPDERNDQALVVHEGDPLACEHVSAKAYASCGAGHAVTDVLHDLADRRPDLSADTVSSVRIRIGTTTARHIGGPYEPSDVTNAQFNLSYCVAAQLLEGDNQIQQFRAELLDDPRILEIARRIEVVGDHGLGADPRRRKECHVSVTFADGTVLEGHADQARDPDRAGIQAKYEALASYALAPAGVAAVLDEVGKLEHLADVAPLARLLTAP